jgi:hypothetical protein
MKPQRIVTIEGVIVIRTRVVYDIHVTTHHRIPIVDTAADVMTITGVTTMIVMMDLQ